MKVLKVFLSTVLVMGLFAAAPKAQAAKKVLLAVYFDNPDYVNARSTFRDELAKASAQQGLDVEFSTLNTKGDKEAFMSRLKEMEPNVDLIFAAGTPNTMAVKVAGITKPVIFSAVANAVGAKLVKSNQHPGTNFTGNYCDIPAGSQLRALLLTLSSAKRIGILYNPNDPVSRAQVKGWKSAVMDMGLELKEYFVPADVNSADSLAEATKPAIGNVDVLVTTADAKVSSYGAGWIKVCNENKLPTYATLVHLTKKGALLSLGYNFAEGAKMNVTQAMKILRGANPADIPVTTFSEYRLVINMNTASKIGVKVPLRALRTASKIIK